MFYGGFFACFVVIYTIILVHFRSQVACTVSLLLKAEISINSEHLPFCHWDLLSEAELQLPPLSGAQNLSFVQVIWLAELSQQSAFLPLLHFQWQNRDSGTHQSYLDVDGIYHHRKRIPKAFQKDKGFRWDGFFFCWTTSWANCLYRSEHTGPFWGTSAAQTDEQEQYWQLPITLLLLLNIFLESTRKLLTWKSVSSHFWRQTWHLSALFLEYRLTTHSITGSACGGVGEEWKISGCCGGGC